MKATAKPNHIVREKMSMLEGKVAICTGAGRGVGAEVAKLMAMHGASVVVNDPGVGGGVNNACNKCKLPRFETTSPRRGLHPAKA